MRVLARFKECASTVGWQGGSEMNGRASGKRGSDPCLRIIAIFLEIRLRNFLLRARKWGDPSIGHAWVCFARRLSGVRVPHRPWKTVLISKKIPDIFIDIGDRLCAISEEPHRFGHAFPAVWSGFAFAGSAFLVVVGAGVARRAAMRFAPFGVPRPVQASHPVFAS